MARHLPFPTFAAAVVMTLPSLAQAGDAALADQLFQQALTFSDAGNWDAACPLFQKSNDADPSVGALLNLAVCAERGGRLLASRAYYEEVATRNEATQDEARKRAVRTQVDSAIAALDQRIPRLRVVGIPAGARVTIDGAAVVLGEQGAPLTVGSHLVRVAASGFRDAEQSVSLVERDRKVVEMKLVPELVPGSEPGATDGAAQSAPMVLPGILLMSGGALVAGAGAALLGLTASKAGEVRDLCGEGARPPACAGSAADALAATELSSEARTFEIAGGVLTGVGAAALATGLIVLIAGATSDGSPETAMSVTLTPGEIGCAFTTRF